MSITPIQILARCDAHLRASGHSEATRCSYLSQVRAWLRWCAEAEPGPRSMQPFVDARAQHHPASADQAVSALQLVAAVEGWQVSLRRPLRVVGPEPLSPQALRRVLAAAEDWREDVVMRLLVEQGMSLSEIASLRVEHVLGGSLRVGRGGPVRRLSHRLQQGLWALCRGRCPRQPVLVGRSGRISVRSLRRLVARVAGRSAVPSLSVRQLREAAVEAPRRVCGEPTRLAAAS